MKKKAVSDEMAFFYKILRKMMEDLLFKGKRNQMVQELKLRGAFSPAVLDAMMQVPRQCFIESGLRHLAYTDGPLPIAGGQTISQPYTVAVQTQLLGCKKWDKVLEIGTGCGYQTAVLSAMGLRVFSIERVKELYIAATQSLDSTGYKAVLNYGDGFAGWPQFAPFAGILITCGAPHLPENLLEQLIPGGKMVIPLGNKSQIMKRYTRLEDGGYKEEEFGMFQFVPMLSGVQ